MAKQVAHTEEWDVGALARHLHKLVTRGPRDLDIAWAMSGFGYDEVKWAEGQGVLAELVTSDWVAEPSLAMAVQWYNEAASVARSALESRPQLLAKLGMT